MQPSNASKSENSEAIVNQKKHKEKSLSSKVSDIVLTAVINTDKETCWTEGKLIFEKEPLESLAVMLSRRYNIHFTFKNKVIGSYLFTGTFNELTLEQILKAIRLSSPINYQINEKEVLITEK
jgi:ferric-dicitrate binding protein FerR (iron transport regulator)